MSGSPRPLPPWLAVKTLFEQLIDLPAADRAAAITRAAVGPEVVAEVLDLLAQHEAEEREERAARRRDTTAHGFLGAPALRLLEPTHEVDRRGERLGPWRLGERLGAGGMGEVWEARRDDGAYEARVAVKVLRRGGDTALRLEHFAQEQRLLARLNHPHIARLLDAGRTADERPYFVLEAVDGLSIDSACRGQPLAERLRLFLQLADAVAHAHRQQLTHRDLKPANVLVTADGQVKLLDFGIAQALDAQLGVAPDAITARPLTPGYASPEQVRGEPVTAATDIYSLGVLLHVLLTGQRPYGDTGRTTNSALRAVLDQPPTAPSRSRPAKPAANDGIAPRQLAGDLDVIVLKALAKPVAGRYASVEQFAADLRAFLAGQPVSARPHTPLYLAGKFVRRHRAAVAASGLALLAIVAGLGATAWQARDAVAALALAALVLGLGVSTWQARRAAAARDEARERLAQTRTLVRDIVMRYADTVTFLPGGLRMKADLLKDTIAYLEHLAHGQGADPALEGERAKALSRLADMQLPGLDATLDEPEEARRNSDAALALFPLGEAPHRDEAAYYMWWARAMRVRAISQRQAGDAQAGLQTALRERAFLQQVLLRFPDDPHLRFEHASTLVGIGQAYDTWQGASLNQPERALEAFGAAETVYLRLHEERPEDGDVLYQLGTLAGAQMIVMKKLGRLDEAIVHGRRGVAWRDRSLAMQPQNVAYRDGAAGERNNFTVVLLESGRPVDIAEALEVSARCEALIHALHVEDPQLATWVTRRRLFALHRGRALLAVGQADEALPRLQDALTGMAEAQGLVGLRRRGLCRLALAQAWQRSDRLEPARLACSDAAADLDAALQDGPGDADALALRRQVQALHDQLQG